MTIFFKLRVYKITGDAPLQKPPCNGPPGYIPKGDFFYKHHSANVSYPDAKALCAADRGWVATFRTQEELKTLRFFSGI